MEWIDGLHGELVGLDTAPIIYFIEEHPAYLESMRYFFEAIEGGILMLNIKEQTIKELDKLKPEALAKVYDLITELKRTNQAKKSKTAATGYLKVREALKQCKGSLSEDIIQEREDRI